MAKEKFRFKRVEHWTVSRRVWRYEPSEFEKQVERNFYAFLFVAFAGAFLVGVLMK